MPLFFTKLSVFETPLLVELSLRILNVGVLETLTLAGNGEAEDDLLESEY